GGEQVQRLGTLLHRRGHHRQRVAQRLARGGGRGDHQVAALARRLPGLRLVRVKRLYPARAPRPSQRGRQVLRQRADVGRRGGDGEVAGDAVAVAVGQALGQAGTGGRGRGQGAFVDDGVHAAAAGEGAPSVAVGRIRT